MSKTCANCGHPKNRHYPACIVTAYSVGTQAVTATPCPCKRFVDEQETT